MKRRCFSSIVPETPLSVNRKRGFSCISPHCPSSADLSGKKRLFSLQTQKCRRGFLRFYRPPIYPSLLLQVFLSLLLQVFLSRPADGGAGKKYDAAPEPPFPADGGEGRAKKRENTESGSETKWEGRGQKSAARAVRRKAVRVGKRKKRREKAEAPPKVLGAPLPKKARCRRQEADRKKRHKRQVLQKPLRQVRLFTSKILRQARFYSGKSGPERRLQRVKACGRSKKARNDVSDFFTRADGCRPLQTPPFKRIAPRQRISLPRP